MKKIYLILTTLFTGIAFEGAATNTNVEPTDFGVPDNSESPMCKIRTSWCKSKSIDGIKNYIAKGCAYQGKKSIISPCYLSFCSLHCRTNTAKRSKCPRDDADKMEMCRKVCRYLNYGNAAIRDGVDACIGGVIDSTVASKLTNLLLKGAKEDASYIKTGSGKVNAWYNSIKKMCEERNKTYITKDEENAFINLTDNMTKLTLTLNRNFSLGEKIYRESYGNQVEAARKLIANSVEITEGYVKSIQDCSNTVAILEKENNRLRILNGDASKEDAVRVIQASFRKYRARKGASLMPPPYTETASSTSSLPSYEQATANSAVQQNDAKVEVNLAQAMFDRKEKAINAWLKNNQDTHLPEYKKLYDEYENARQILERVKNESSSESTSGFEDSAQQ